MPVRGRLPVHRVDRGHVRKVFSLLRLMVALTLLSPALMAAALLYSAMSANVSERTGELGTLQAAGMGARVRAGWYRRRT